MPLGVLLQRTSCPLAQVMRTYLATSRDGVHFDTGWVYAAQELVPHGECRAPPGCASNDELRAALPEVFLEGGPRLWAELCCPFDHGIVIPASQLLSFNGEHLLHYEGRQARHEPDAVTSRDLP